MKITDEAVEAAAKAIADAWGETWGCVCTSQLGLDCDCGDAMTDERGPYDERLSREDCRMAARAALAAALPHLSQGAVRDEWFKPSNAVFKKPTLSLAPVGVSDGVTDAANDLLVSLDPETLNPEQFNAWSALADALASHDPTPTDTQEGMEWQPIETAPKGSEMFLAYAPPSNDFPDGRTIIVKGSILASMMAEGTPNHLAFPATHWMPLPVPPAAGQSNE